MFHKLWQRRERTVPICPMGRMGRMGPIGGMGRMRARLTCVLG